MILKFLIIFEENGVWASSIKWEIIIKITIVNKKKESLL